MWWTLVSLPVAIVAVITPASEVAKNYSLTVSTTLASPTSTLSSSDTEAFLIANWGLSKGRVQNSPEHLSFVDDPFPNSKPPVDGSEVTSGPVLRVDYPAGGFGPMESGTQLYSLFNDSQPLRSMLISYDIAFDDNFEWNKGGKLPGIRGGPNPNGCSGGSQPNGTDCFSTRIMWRKAAAGEVYAYIPRSNDICDDNNDFKCNEDFGVSIQRGSFGFQSSKWDRVSLLVRLNEPADSSNGYVAVYFNDALALSQAGLQIRESDSINIGGLYLSSFFGGSDSSWAPSIDQHIFFRNFQLWAGAAPSDLKASSGFRASPLYWIYCSVLALLYLF